MKKLIASTFVSLDGVLQAPGAQNWHARRADAVCYRAIRS